MLRLQRHCPLTPSEVGLTAIALRVPGKLEWDSKNMRFTNSAEANRLLKPVFLQRLEFEDLNDGGH